MKDPELTRLIPHQAIAEKSLRCGHRLGISLDTPAPAAAARAVHWCEGRPFVWAAAESDPMKQLRHPFKRERRLSSKDLYISSDWKQGLLEDAHKQVKRADAERDV